MPSFTGSKFGFSVLCFLCAKNACGNATRDSPRVFEKRECDKLNFKTFFPMGIDVFITSKTEVRSIRRSCIIFQKFEMTTGKANS